MSRATSPLKNAVCRWLAGLGMLLACAGNVHALGMDLPYASFATAPDVDWIKVCGKWSVPSPAQTGVADEGRGMYRIVHATRYGQSAVYVQWLARDGNDTATEVHTESFEQINNDHAEITLSQMNCQRTRKGIRFTARAQSGHDKSAFRITIDAGHKPGEVHFRTSQKR